MCSVTVGEEGSGLQRRGESRRETERKRHNGNGRLWLLTGSPLKDDSFSALEVQLPTINTAVNFNNICLKSILIQFLI